jgi:hypothetical protein
MTQVITTKITQTEYAGLEQAYDWFNADLFGGQLPAVLITLQRKANSRGYFSGRRFSSRLADGNLTDELALNPATFEGRTDMEILSTLVHEMVHVWQAHSGNPGRGKYHNAEWGDKMESIGLMPSDTGKPGGKRTGQGMTHYIIAGGPFEQSAKKLLSAAFRLNWQSVEANGQGKTGGSRAASKVKFTCPSCGQNAWGKPDLFILCGSCSEPDFLIQMEQAD